MFLYQETYYVRPGLQEVIDRRVRGLHENHITNAAAAAMDWMKYLGDATTYLAFRLWYDRQVSFDEAQSAFMSEYNRTRPADAFIAPPDIEFFEQIEQKGRVLDAATFLSRCDLNVSGRSSWTAWEAELRERLLADEHFAEYRLYRFMGGETRYMRAEFWHNRDAALEFWRKGEMREFSKALEGLRRPPEFAHYDVLHQTGSAKPMPILVV